MEANSDEFCCGCLSTGRKMKRLLDYWVDRSFHKLLTEIQILESDTCLLLLCWECEARITNFLIFKDQLKSSCEILQEYVKKNRKSKPQSVSKLKICTLEITDTNMFENDKVKVKDEIDEHYTNHAEIKVKDDTESYSDDNKSLVELSLEKKKKLQRSKKKVSKREKKTGEVVKKAKENVMEFETIILNPEEILEEREIMRQKEEFVNSMFKCDKCIIAFANNDDLKEHELTKHLLNASKHTCNICERTFSSEHSLAAHSRGHSLRFGCAACAHRAATERAARAHYARKHNDGYSEMFELATKAYQTSGEEIAIDDDRTKSKEMIPCEYCEKKFRWKTSLRKHMETHRIEAGHKRKPYCETCRLSFSTSTNLRKHMKTSSKHQIKLKLSKLKDPADPDSQLAQDLDSIRSSINCQRERFPCPQCEKRFQWKGNLLRHLRSHAARANGDLVCEPCNRTFSSIATYKQHMKISRKHVTENEFKYMCSDCGKRFSNKIKLRDHIDWEHLKKYTHTCAECQKVFRSHTSLYLHRQVVHRLCNAEHLCDHCGKSFPNKTKLSSHIIALHTRDSPYKCETCAARFSWHSCLSRHVRRVHRNVIKNNETRVC